MHCLLRTKERTFSHTHSHHVKSIHTDGQPLADDIAAALGGISPAEGDSKERENRGDSRPSSPRTVQPRILVVMNSAMQRKMLVRVLVNLDETWQINEAVDSGNECTSFLSLPLSLFIPYLPLL